MKTISDFVQAFYDEMTKGPLTGEETADQLKKSLRDYGEAVRGQIIDLINEARQEGEWDIRSVRTRIERMKIE